MCGIAGLLSTRRDGAREAVERMVEHLRHRGPDDRGVDAPGGATPPSVVLGHTRLAIIDLSPAGHGPMRSGDRRYSITFNGEIYNFKALRAELEPRQWRSHSDTEVLLEAYATWGRACVERLRGMFAFGLWDTERQELFLARDRLGIKPLYYYTADGVFAFASEVGALLASGLVPQRIDPLGLGEYLAYQSLPAPRTLIENVRMLPPGGWMVVDSEARATHGRYWDQLAHASRGAREAALDDSRRHIRELLYEAVESHQVSDVPVGAFLSGGIDSSAIVALMREAGHIPHTFSIGFTEQAYDETEHARAIAHRFGTEHTHIQLSEQDLLHQLPDALRAMDQPTGDGVNTFVISRAVRASGIKVALSGLGGDELFGGYPSFRRLSRTAALFRTWGRAPEPVRAITASTVQALGQSSVAAGKAAAMLASTGRLADLYPVTRQVLSSEQRQSLLAEAWTQSSDPYVELLEDAFDRAPHAGLMTAISYAEGRTYMHDVLLRDTDQMSMAHGLEVRVPLLDHVLVEYVMGLPEAHKRPSATPKSLLVDSLAGLLPDEIVHRPKQGFTFPFDVWMRGELRGFCEERLGTSGLGGRAMFQHYAVQDLWDAFLDRRPHASWSRVWVLVVLEEWLRRHGF
jgi:asparagine synthase (glutamine-hydrolysing)